jgi:hypothetical protein
MVCGDFRGFLYMRTEIAEAFGEQLRLSIEKRRKEFKKLRVWIENCAFGKRFLPALEKGT